MEDKLAARFPVIRRLRNRSKEWRLWHYVSAELTLQVTENVSLLGRKWSKEAELKGSNKCWYAVDLFGG